MPGVREILQATRADEVRLGGEGRFGGRADKLNREAEGIEKERSKRNGKRIR